MNILRKLIFSAALIAVVAAQGPICNYINDSNDGLYTCILTRATVTPDVNVEIGGRFDEGKSFEDVGKVTSNEKASEFIVDPLFKTFKNLKKIEFNQGEFESINATIFQNCPATLEKIMIKASTFKPLQANIFSNCSALIELDLGSNAIDTIDRNSFAGLQNLKILKLNDNKLGNIIANVFNSLPSLETLDVSRNKLKEFDNRVFVDNKNLTYLNIAQNNIEFLKMDYFVGLELLSTLDATNNVINATQKEMFDELKGLKVVKFKENVCIDKDFDSFSETDIDDFKVCIDNFNGASILIMSNILLFVMLFIKFF